MLIVHNLVTETHGYTVSEALPDQQLYQQQEHKDVQQNSKASGTALQHVL
jgi:hypothetical protein